MICLLSVSEDYRKPGFSCSPYKKILTVKSPVSLTKYWNTNRHVSTKAHWQLVMSLVMEKRINFSENSCATNNSKTPLSVCPSSKGELGDQTRQKERYFDRGWIRPIKTFGLVPLSLYIHQLHYEARRFFAPCGPLIPFSRANAQRGYGYFNPTANFLFHYLFHRATRHII